MDHKNIKSFKSTEYKDGCFKLDTQYDMVNSPAHYTQGRSYYEVIEDSISTAPTPMLGFLQGQVLKYMLRLWLKKTVKKMLKKQNGISIN